MDGWITIGTKLNTKQLEKDLKSTESKLKKLQDKDIELKEQRIKFKPDLDNYRKEMARIQSQFDKEMKTAKTPFETQMVTDTFNKQIDETNAKYQKTFDKLTIINQKIKQNHAEQGLLKGQVEDINSKLKQSKGWDGLKKSVNDVEKGMGKIVKKAVKWGLAIFSIRSAYSFLRQAVSTLSQHDEQLAADIEQIRYALASTLEPVIKRIVDLVYTLLGYLRYIIKAWTGKDIFANSKKGLEKTSKGVSKLQKQLASFDEMNILSDNSSGGGGGATGRDIPSFGEGDVPEWVKWISQNGGTIAGIIGAIAGAIALMKLSKVAEDLGLIGSHLSFIQGLGIAAIIFGVYEIVSGFVENMEKVDSALEENGTAIKDWAKVVAGVGLVVIGFALLIGAWPVALAGAIVLMIGIMMKYWEEIKTFLKDKVFGWIDEQIEKCEQNVFLTFFANILHEVKRVVTDWMGYMEDLFSGIKLILDGITMIFKGDFKNGLLNIGKGILNALIGMMNMAISGINTILFPLRSAIAAIGKVMGKDWSLEDAKIPQIPRLAKGGIINMPGRGVPIGGAIAGEAGREAVLPLTDSQQMQLLGEAIGKYITINASITNTMNGRVISRELQKINNEQDFAYNR